MYLGFYRNIDLGLETAGRIQEDRSRFMSSTSVETSIPQAAQNISVSGSQKVAIPRADNVRSACHGSLENNDILGIAHRHIDGAIDRHEFARLAKELDVVINLLFGQHSPGLHTRIAKDAGHIKEHLFTDEKRVVLGD
jgi:hypothetical protein